jgi:hypothetical protein
VTFGIRGWIFNRFCPALQAIFFAKMEEMVTASEKLRIGFSETK